VGLLQRRLRGRGLRQGIGRHDRHPESAGVHHLHELAQDRRVHSREDGGDPRSAVRDRTGAQAARPHVGGGVQDTLADTIHDGVDPVGRQSPDATGDALARRDRPLHQSNELLALRGAAAPPIRAGPGR
jgi:hypothetical protein